MKIKRFEKTSTARIISLMLATTVFSFPVLSQQLEEVKVQAQETIDQTDPSGEIQPQTEPVVESEREEIEQIVVTGSRIKRDEFSTNAPVTIITSERSALAGLLDTADILQGSTVASGQQIDDSFSGFVTDGGPGANSVSLRGLGAQRTLVLVNGKRWGPSGVRGSVNSVDLSAIPSSIISRIEILKDGASSIYGADAVAGVVNVITKERADGLQLNTALSAPFDGGAEEFNINAVWGMVGDDWSINVAADYNKLERLVRSERDWASCDRRPRITDQDGDGTIDNRDPTTGEELCFGSIYGLVSGPFGFTRFDPTLTPGTGPENPSFDPLVNGVFGIPFFTTVDEGPLDNQGAFYRDNVIEYDAAEIVPVSEAFSLTSFGEKDLDLFGRTSSAYYEFYYNRRETNANSGYQQLFPVVPASNPSNPFGTNGPLAGLGSFSVLPVMMSWNVLDPTDTIEIDRTQTFVGLKGDLSDTWTYDVNVGFSQSTGKYKAQRILTDRLEASLDAVLDANGNLVCRNPNAFGGCVAANWFTADNLLNGNFPQEYLNFIRKDTVGETDYSSVQLSGFASGDLFELPGGAAKAVIGIDIRNEEIDDKPDPEAQRDNIFSTTVAGRTKGDDTVKEVFAELEMPLLSNMKFVEELNLNLAARYTDYDSYGSDVTERAQINWQVNPSIRLRATSGTSFRAPDLFEQFLGDQTGFLDVTLFDPCINYGDGRAAGDPIFDNCASLGLAPDFGTSGGVPSVRTVTGGNPDLEAETSESTTLGVVITPEGTNFSLALNYFDIELENSVSRPTIGFVLFDCYTSVGFSSPFCSRIANRDGNGFLTDIDASLLNVGVERSEGFDLDITYSKVFESWELTADLTATKLEDQFFELLGDEFELEGRWGFPEYTGELDLYADWKDWRFLWNMSYIGSSEEEPVFDPGTENRDRINATDSIVYHNLSARYTSPNEWQAILTIRNLLDEEPPLVSDGQQSNSATRVFNTLPGVGYDLLGRTIVLQFSKQF
ncbi:MAG: TonB-dependent receptor [Gammaproteobacteria bacterium]|nr:TonB-dependent receptor [Gammaproteobacteria bacterium]